MNGNISPNRLQIPFIHHKQEKSERIQDTISKHLKHLKREVMSLREQSDINIIHEQEKEDIKPQIEEATKKPQLPLFQKVLPYTTTNQQSKRKKIKLIKLREESINNTSEYHSPTNKRNIKFFCPNTNNSMSSLQTNLSSSQSYQSMLSLPFQNGRLPKLSLANSAIDIKPLSLGGYGSTSTTPQMRKLILNQRAWMVTIDKIDEDSSSSFNVLKKDIEEMERSKSPINKRLLAKCKKNNLARLTEDLPLDNDNIFSKNTMKMYKNLDYVMSKLNHADYTSVFASFNGKDKTKSKIIEKKKQLMKIEDQRHKKIIDLVEKTHYEALNLSKKMSSLNIKLKVDFS